MRAVADPDSISPGPIQRPGYTGLLLVNEKPLHPACLVPSRNKAGGPAPSVVCTFCQTSMDTERPGYTGLRVVDGVPLHQACVVPHKQLDSAPERDAAEDAAPRPAALSGRSSSELSLSSSGLRVSSRSRSLKVPTVSFPSEGRILSPLLLHLGDDAAVTAALSGARLKLTLLPESHDDGDTKTEWFLVRAAVVNDTDGVLRGTWVVARTYAQFVHFHKALMASSCALVTDLPPASRFKYDKSDPGPRVAALGKWLSLFSQLNAVLLTTSVAVARFADPFDSPSFVGLRAIGPDHEGWMDTWTGKASPQRLYCVLKGDLFCFDKDWQEKLRISLEYVTVDMSETAGKVAFTITNLQQKAFYFGGLDSTKALAEWVLALRKVKCARSAALSAFRPSPQPVYASTGATDTTKVASVREALVRFLETGNPPPLKTDKNTLPPSLLEPVEEDSPTNVVLADKQRPAITKSSASACSDDESAGAPASAAKPASPDDLVVVVNPLMAAMEQRPDKAAKLFGSRVVVANPLLSMMEERLDRAAKLRLSAGLSSAAPADSGDSEEMSSVKPTQLSVLQATLPKLLEKLLDPFATEPGFVDMFLLVYRYWLRPSELLSFVEQKWIQSSYDTVSHATVAQLRMVLLLKQWLTQHFLDDFAGDLDLTAQLLSFVHFRLLQFSPFAVPAQEVSEVLKKLAADLTARLEGYRRGQVAQAPASLLSAFFSPGNLELLDLNPLEAARQLTLIEFKMYESIRIVELHDQHWVKKGEDVSGA